MSWITFAVAAALVWAVVNIIDKYILTRWAHPALVVLVLGVVGLATSGLIYVFRGFSSLDFTHIGIALIAGAVYALASILYFTAAQREEISRVAPLFHLAPLFVAFLAAIFLGEVFGPYLYLGIILLFAGSALLTSRGISLRPGAHLWPMVASAVSFAVHLVLIKYLLNSTDYWTVLGYARIGTFLALVPVAVLNRDSLISFARRHGALPAGIIACNEALNMVGVVFYYSAASMGFITLVEALTTVQSFFVLIIASALSIWYPKFLVEEASARTVARKAAAIGLLVVGALLVT